jgi:thiosulfate reductase cytochrome b subunit
MGDPTRAARTVSSVQTSPSVAPAGPVAPPSAALSRRTRLPALALCAWTLFTWVTRVPLAWSDDELSAAGKVAATVPVLVFVVLALVTGVALLRRAAVAPLLVAGLGVWSIGYWAIRMALIATNGHEVAFVVVHAVLALVASGLAVAALVGLSADGALPGRPRSAAT